MLKLFDEKTYIDYIILYPYMEGGNSGNNFEHLVSIMEAKNTKNNLYNPCNRMKNYRILSLLNEKHIY